MKGGGHNIFLCIFNTGQLSFSHAERDSKSVPPLLIRGGHIVNTELQWCAPFCEKQSQGKFIRLVSAESCYQTLRILIAQLNCIMRKLVNMYSEAMFLRCF